MENPPYYKTRLSDVKSMMAWGNHKSALTLENSRTMRKIYTNEVMHGWLIPLLKQTVFKIKGAYFILLGVAE